MGLFDFLNNRKSKEPRKTRKPFPEETELQIKISAQDKQLKSILQAEESFETNHDINSLIAFWEDIWSNGGLLFNGSKWTFRLPDLYLKQKRYDDALRILDMINNPAYQDKRKAYVKKIQSAKKNIRK